jgi:hypothetical protein
MLSIKGKIKKLLDGLRIPSTTEIVDLFYNVILYNKPVPIPEFHLLDIESLFGAIMADPFAAADWKATFTEVIATSGAKYQIGRL